MADEKTDTTKVEDEETPDGSEGDAHDRQKISETVKNLSNKSLKQLSKWNNESFLYAFDRQLISFGIRLLLFLPGFAILAYFGAWAYANSSPIGGLILSSQQLGEFLDNSVALVFVILLGYILHLPYIGIELI